MVGAGAPAGRTTVARASLFHQISAATTPMTTTMAVGREYVAPGVALWFDQRGV